MANEEDTAPAWLADSEDAAAPSAPAPAAVKNTPAPAAVPAAAPAVNGNDGESLTSESFVLSLCCAIKVHIIFLPPLHCEAYL